MPAGWLGDGVGDLKHAVERPVREVLPAHQHVDLGELCCEIRQGNIVEPCLQVHRPSQHQVQFGQASRSLPGQAADAADLIVSRAGAARIHWSDWEDHSFFDSAPPLRPCSPLQTLPSH